MESLLTKKVTEKVNELVDEETTRKLGELNIVTEISEEDKGFINIRFQPLSAYSPLAVDTGRGLREAALSVEGVKGVRVECSGHMMDELVNRVVNQEGLGPKKAIAR